MSRRRRGRSTRVFAMVTVLAIVSMLAMSAQDGIGVPSGEAQDRGPMQVTSSSDDARQRLHPTLIRSVDDAPNSQVMVHAYVKAGTDLSAYMPDALPRAWASPDGITIVSGTVQARQLVKIADVEGVITVDPMRGGYEPTLAPDSAAQEIEQPDSDLRSKMNQTIQSTDQNARPNSGDADVDPHGWADVLDTHHSKEAWDKGYTGDGVKVMANDSGIDFGNPDLMGTWAMVEDENSPYYGWPLQFDGQSMFLYARDVMLGESNTANGAGAYADTSAVVTEDSASFQTLDADEEREYTLPGTSQSGEYRMGTHPDTSLRPWYFVATGEEPPEEGEENGPVGERPAILVSDENDAGVYDTVYVDLDFDNDFSDEQPVNQDTPVSCADWWGAFDPDMEDFAPEPDGMCDISGGLVYWISDGANVVPGSDWLWGFGEVENEEGEIESLGIPGNGDLVLFSVNDFARSPGGNHGQLVASAIAANGVVDGDSADLILGGAVAGGASPDYKPEDAGGMVQAAGRDVKLVSAGDFYAYGAMDAHVFAALGYDGIPGTIDDMQVINDSWGSSAIHNDGWDEISRVIDSLTRTVNPSLLVTVAVGNGSPGFGTVASPAPPSALLVGASTQHGSTGWDSATSADQITRGDVASFSGRGPGARGDSGVNVVASGSRASGSIPVNQALSGAHAWTTWGGTSRAAPIAAGNAALVYQAHMETYGMWPNYDTTKMLLMSGATDLHYDPFLQGAGAVNASRSVDLASGADGTFTWPSEYLPGDWDGETYPGFANVLEPGDSHDRFFEISNPTSEQVHLDVTDQWLQKTGEWEEDWTSAPISEEPIEISEGEPVETELDWNTPHYLWDVTDQIPEDTDMVVFRMNFDTEYYDPEQSYDWEQTNSWYLLSYDWTDVDGDEQLWNDANGNGIVDPDEIDEGEYVRMEYSNNRATSKQVTVQMPHDRMHDGVFLGLQHSQAREDVPQTPMTIGMDFYEQVDMPWIDVGQRGELTVHPNSTGRIRVEVDVPGDAPVGLYEAGIKVSDGDHDTIVPVVMNVASNRQNMDAGNYEFNNHPSDAFYNSEQVYGSQSWSWRQESGDWRFYYSDLAEQAGPLENSMPDGSFFYLADVEWQNMQTDLDLHVLSPVEDDFSEDEPEYFGPYSLGVSASSNSAYVGAGTYRVDTSSGANREVIAAPYVPGLNAVLAHNTNFEGSDPSEDISLQTGLLGVSENPISISGQEGFDQSAGQTLMSSIGLSGLNVQGFGLSTPEIDEGAEIQQDNPNDPSTASYTREFSMDNAGLLDIQAVGQEEEDIDLYLLQDMNGDGEFDFETEQIAASTTATAEERIRIQLPEDGDYMLAVHGWAVPEAGSTFDLSLLAVQGDDIATSEVPEGEITPNRSYDIDIDFASEDLAPGQYTGVLTIGPPEGPSAVIVFVEYLIE